jgi:1-deoxy-D-xylulose-5-phosphate synthase
MGQLLKNIQSPKDIKNFSTADLNQLAQELRQMIIDEVSKKEGHLGASLGVVELTIALHYIFDTPNEPLIWDVGHQAYGHKILTERQKLFHTNRTLKGLSGFPKRSESIYDSFGTGHSSTAISAILGMALANQLKGANKAHIAVIGDASIASGMAFEALNHLGETQANVLIILNDNSMGIDPSVGALKNYLIQIKDKKFAQHQNVFQALNINYSGPIDGHDLPLLCETLKKLK